MTDETICLSNLKFGSWCCFCGGYYTDMDEATAMEIASTGCDRCIKDEREREAERARMMREQKRNH